MKMKRFLAFLLFLALTFTIMSQTAFAGQDMTLDEGRQKKSVRTIMFYICGSNLETDSGMATYNIHQILKSDFSKNEDIKFIVMTGGAAKWHVESSCLVIDPELLPDGESEDSVSGNYNQIWEARGADALSDPGKMIMLEGGGISGNGEPVQSENELMSDPDTLKQFINYCAENYPAEQYDLIMWDHGCGPAGGFGKDDHDPDHTNTMSFPEIVDALSHNNVTDSNGDGVSDSKFDFIDFDACMMNNAELNLVLSDYMDYYVASAETEPGYGQYYTGWLNILGQDPHADAYRLGRKMVDDFYDFYTDGEGKGEEGTLAVVDSKKLMQSEFPDALSDTADMLNDQVALKLFYDEFKSLDGSIGYGDEPLFDMGNLASMLGVVRSEIEQTNGNAADDQLYSTNRYTDITARLSRVMSDEEIIYARGTDGIISKDQIFRDNDGDVVLGNLFTSGMQIWFTPMSGPEKAADYYDRITEVMENMKDKDDVRYKFLEKYRDAMIDYALVISTGKTVNDLINEDHVAKSEIDYNKVKNKWTGGAEGDDIDKYSTWELTVKPLLARRHASGKSSEEEWLDDTIHQQAEEALTIENVTASSVKQKQGTGYKIYINDVKKRVINSVRQNVRLELPVLESYLEANFEPRVRSELASTADMSLGYVEGEQYPPEGDTWKDYVDWYNKKESIWDLRALEEKWYAVNDASGSLHVAAIYDENVNDNSIDIVGIDESDEDRSPVVLTFDTTDNRRKLKEITCISEAGQRPVKPSELTNDISFMPAVCVEYRGFMKYYLPISKRSFTISADNAGDITLDYTDIARIDDIDDTDGDGKSIDSLITITDLYNEVVNITDLVNESESKLIDISLARVKPGIYTGERVEPEIVYRGRTLKEGTDYTWDFYKIPEDSPERDLIGPEQTRILITGKGEFTGTAVRSYRIIRSVSDAYDLVDEAEEKLKNAEAAMEEALQSGSAAQLDDAYRALLEAQNALSEAKDTLSDTLNVLSEDEKAELQEEIDELEERVTELTSDLAKALVVDISNYAVTMKTKYVYTGMYIEPEVSVSGLDSSDYEILMGYDGGIDVGTTDFVIKARGYGYKGEIHKSFTIVPKRAAFSRISTGKKKMTVKAKVKPSETGGNRYEIQYRIKGTYTWKKTMSSKQSKTIKKLKKGKKYQVRIRAYKKIDGKTYYGAWSRTRTTGKVK